MPAGWSVCAKLAERAVRMGMETRQASHADFTLSEVTIRECTLDFGSTSLSPICALSSSLQAQRKLDFRSSDLLQGDFKVILKQRRLVLLLPWLQLQPPSCETWKQSSLHDTLCLIEVSLFIESIGKGTLAYV